MAKYSDPKLFILKILMGNLPKSVVKGKLRNMENEFFEEYFGLLSSLIKISKDYFFIDNQLTSGVIEPLEKEQAAEQREFFDEKVNKFLSSDILAFCIEIVKLNHYILSGLILQNDRKLSESKQSSTERLLCGYLQLCQSILEVIPLLKDRAANEYNLIVTITDFILNSNQSS